MKFTGLPKSAADFRAWMDNVYDIVTAAARDPDEAFAWVIRVENEEIEFDELGKVSFEMKSLDSKIRSGLTRYLHGKEAEKEKQELTSFLLRKRDELRKAMPPKQITARTSSLFPYRIPNPCVSLARRSRM